MGLQFTEYLQIDPLGILESELTYSIAEGEEHVSIKEPSRDGQESVLVAVIDPLLLERQERAFSGKITVLPR